MVLGGTALAGGRGSVLGTLRGVFILAVVDNTFNQLEVNSFLKDVVCGVITCAQAGTGARPTAPQRSSMPALLFGSISTIADTSELQRQAFNRAFAAHGLDWDWDRETYLGLLEQSGGQQRIAAYADARSESVDAVAVHKTKTEQFHELVEKGSLAPREGVVETMQAARAVGYKVALVTTTDAANVSSVVGALSPDLALTDFDLVVHSASVERPKPDPAAYAFALAQMGEDPADCVAVEDNLDGVSAATAAGLACVAFPNENTAQHTFDKVSLRVDALRFPELQAVIPSR